MNQRIKPNPLADEFEKRHGTMLDEIHRLIAGLFDGCVTMPHGLEFRRNGKPRRATDSECTFGQIWFPAELRFRLDKPTVAQEAALQLEGLAHELLDAAKAIRTSGETIEGKPSVKIKTA